MWGVRERCAAGPSRIARREPSRSAAKALRIPGSAVVRLVPRAGLDAKGKDSERAEGPPKRLPGESEQAGRPSRSTRSVGVHSGRRVQMPFVFLLAMRRAAARRSPGPRPRNAVP